MKGGERSGREEKRKEGKGREARRGEGRKRKTPCGCGLATRLNREEKW